MVIFPNQDTIYHYKLDAQNGEMMFKGWGDYTEEFIYKKDEAFFNIIVPTIDTTKYSFIIKHLLSKKKNIYLTGVSGTGKSILISSLLTKIKEPYKTDNF